MRHNHVVFTLVVASLSVVIASRDAHAQAAWVAEKGALDVSFDYNLGISNKVVGDGDLEFKDAGTTTNQLTIGAEYVPVPKLAVGFALPLAVLKYTGDKTMYPHPAGGSYDDGKNHTTLTDLRVGARYAVLAEPIALSPHIGVSIPVADYETIGNTVAGRHLKALHLGLGLGKAIGMAYFQLVYEFSLVEKYDQTADTKKQGQNRSDGSLSIGYKLLEGKLDLNLGANFRQTHGGVAFADFATLTPDELMFHDAILKEQIILVGGGIGYDINDSVSVSLAARAFVSGQNTQNANVFGLSLAWKAL